VLITAKRNQSTDNVIGWLGSHVPPRIFLAGWGLLAVYAEHAGSFGTQLKEDGWTGVRGNGGRVRISIKQLACSCLYFVMPPKML